MFRNRIVSTFCACLIGASTIVPSQSFAFGHVFHRGFNGTLTDSRGYPHYGGENSSASITLMRTRTDASKNAVSLEIDSRVDDFGQAIAINPTHLGKVSIEWITVVGENIKFDPWNRATSLCFEAQLGIHRGTIQTNCPILGNPLYQHQFYNRNPTNATRHFLLKNAHSKDDFRTLVETIQLTAYMVQTALNLGITTVFLDVKGAGSINATVEAVKSLNLTWRQKYKLAFEIEPSDLNPALPGPIPGGKSLGNQVQVAARNIYLAPYSAVGQYGYQFVINVPEGGVINKLYNAAINELESVPNHAPEAQLNTTIAQWIVDGMAPRTLQWGWNMLSSYNDASRFRWFSKAFKINTHDKSRYPRGAGLWIMEWKPGPEAYFANSTEVGGINRDGSCCFPLDTRATVPDSSRVDVDQLTYDEPDGRL